jgi:Uma2 family endonuclease
MVMTMRRTELPELWWDDFVPPTGLRAEIIQGELVLTPSPTLDHGFAQTRLFRALDAQLPVGYEIVQGIEWRLAVEGIVAAAPQPDIMVVPQQSGTRVLTVSPLLAVEVLSPSDGQLLPQGVSRIEGKRLDFAANGLEHYLEVEWAADVCTVRRYELCDGELAVVDVAEGDGLLVSAVPYDYEIRPSRL